MQDFTSSGHKISPHQLVAEKKVTVVNTTKGKQLLTKALFNFTWNTVAWYVTQITRNTSTRLRWYRGEEPDTPISGITIPVPSQTC